MNLSACWIVKNEEKNIGKSIDSVAGAVDELIVVDTGSTDKTVEIAEQKGARVLHFEWIADFAAAKNFALDNAKKGFVIFLDADEYFEEPLTQKDRNFIINVFNSHKNIDLLSVPRDDIELSDGRVKCKGESTRILRHDGKVKFVGKIHEEMTLEGKKPFVAFYDKKIIHTGYTKEIALEKAVRNAKLLDEVVDGSIDTYEAFHNQLYIMRENQILDPEKSFESWKITVPQTRFWEYGIMRYGYDFLTHLMRAIVMPLNRRQQVSRKFIKKYLIDLFKKYYKGYYLAPLIDLIYMQLYDKRDDLLLAEFDDAIAESEKREAKDFYEGEKKLLEVLYISAAQAASNLGQTERAAKYAVKALDTEKSDGSEELILEMIIDNVTDKEPAQAVEILNGIYPEPKEDDKHFLTKQLLRDDTRELYIYYLKQLANEGIATIDEKLIYALLSGGINGALSAAQQVLASGEERAFASVGALLFMMTISFNNDGLYRSNPQGLAAYARIIESYFSGDPIEDVTNDETLALTTYYPFIAFLGGKEIADKFLHVFKNIPKVKFAVMEQYQRRSRNFNAIYEYDTSDLDEKDWFVNIRKIYAAIKTGNYDYAYKKLKEVTAYSINDEVFDMLLLTAQLSSGEVQKDAYDLYNKYIEYFEKMIDWNDIINTKIIVEKKDVRINKTIAAMDSDDLKKTIENAHVKTDMIGYYMVLENVLEIYKEQNYIQQYFDGLIELIAADKNREQNTDKLKELFKEMGNGEAVKALEYA